MLTIFELKQLINSLKNSMQNIKNILNIDAKQAKLQEIEKQIIENYDDIKLYASLSKDKTMLTNLINEFNSLQSDTENLYDLIQLPENELDSNMLNEIESLSNVLAKKIKTIHTRSLFSNKTDYCNAFLEINSGAGGTESQDWSEMLLRMYLMWADSKHFKTEIIDKLDGDEAGIKSVVVQISGEFAYGLLKNETGTHRLVRISPFNANGKRQTSFAGIFCYPEVSDDIKINIDPKDLRIDVYRSSGAGGQHVNKTESAVRITHIPTGIAVSSQTQRSQLQNRENAMKMLKSKLYEIELKKKDDEKQMIENGKSDISWGNQIRNYVLHPYKMVKDLRSNFEVGNADSVLDGNLDDIIESVLTLKAKELTNEN